MGLRQLRHLAIPAELAAKITARSKAVELSQALTMAGLIDNDLIANHMEDNSNIKLTQALTDSFDPQEGQALPHLLHDIAERAQQ